MKYELTSEGFKCGSRTYVGECIETDLFNIGYDKFDGKVYRYPNGKYQIVKASKKVFRVPIPGILPQRPIHRWDDPDRTENRTDNIHRAHNRIYQILLSNEWDYFLTMTFDQEKLDSRDISLTIKKTQIWLKNMTQRNGIGYVLVPEYHKKDKRVHCHAIVKGKLNLKFDDIYAVEGFKKPVRMAKIKRLNISPDKIRYPVYNCSDWKYGFSTAINVYDSPSRLANYVLKYMTKDQQMIFGRSYWCSKNLKLYPDIELYNLKSYEYRDTIGREYYTRGSEASYKYINRLGDTIRDMSDDEVVVKTYRSNA